MLSCLLLVFFLYFFFNRGAVQFLNPTFLHSCTSTAAILSGCRLRWGRSLWSLPIPPPCFFYQHPSGFLLLFLHSVSSSGEAAPDYYYSSLFAALVALATASARQQFKVDNANTNIVLITASRLGSRLPDESSATMHSACLLSGRWN